MAKEFSAQVEDWVTKVEGLLEAVFKESLQDVIIDMNNPKAKGGNMPVKTGFLRSSLRITVGGPATGLLDRPAEYNMPEGEDREVSLTIAGADIYAQPIYAVYLAKYAMARNYGTTTAPGDHFRDLAVQKWQQFVSKNVASVRRQ